MVSQPNDTIFFADMVILAVPDVALGKVSTIYIPMKPRVLVVTPDPAVALVIKLLTFMMSRILSPIRPISLYFNWEPNEAAMQDHFGGVAAKQSDRLYRHEMR